MSFSRNGHNGASSGPMMRCKQIITGKLRIFKVMKIKRLSIILLAMTLSVVLVSCSKNIEKKIIGKWHVSSIMEINSPDGDWHDVLYNQNFDYEFKDGGSVTAYVNGSPAGSSSWSYDKDAEKLVFASRPYDIEQLDEHQMVLYYSYITDVVRLEQRMTLDKQ